MSELQNKTLAQIVTANHQTASVFEKYHLDFCCKGKRPLAEALQEKQLSTEQVVKELNEIIGKATTQDAELLNHVTLAQLCDYIVATHHAYVQQNMPQIYAYLEKVATKHGGRHPELVEIFELFAQVKEEMTGHMQKEEHILFPRIKQVEKLYKESASFQVPAGGYIEIPVSVMEREHDDAGYMIEEIRIKTNNYTPPEDACTTYRVAFASLQAFEADLHQHVHMENNILFPRAIDLIQKISHSSSN